MTTNSLQYLSQAGNPARFSDIEDVREAFHEHRMFLITSMLEGQEGVHWLNTPLFAYFKKNFPVSRVTQVFDLALIQLTGGRFEPFSSNHTSRSCPVGQSFGAQDRSNAT